MALAFGRLGHDAVHLVIDMQVMFAAPGEWCTPGLQAIVPLVLRLTRQHVDRTLFTRFVPPRNAEDATGAWRRYYERWSAYTADRLAPGSIELVSPLDALARSADIIDKPGHSAFGPPMLHELLQSRGVRALVVSGVETDVCVLATVLQAVDLGYRVIIAGDAVASSSAAGHASTLEHVLPRLDQQVEIAKTADILAQWN